MEEKRRKNIGTKHFSEFEDHRIEATGCRKEPIEARVMLLSRYSYLQWLQKRM